MNNLATEIRHIVEDHQLSAFLDEDKIDSIKEAASKLDLEKIYTLSSSESEFKHLSLVDILAYYGKTLHAHVLQQYYRVDFKKSLYQGMRLALINKKENFIDFLTFSYFNCKKHKDRYPYVDSSYFYQTITKNYELFRYQFQTDFIYHRIASDPYHFFKRLLETIETEDYKEKVKILQYLISFPVFQDSVVKNFSKSIMGGADPEHLILRALRNGQFEIALAFLKWPEIAKAFRDESFVIACSSFYVADLDNINFNDVNAHFTLGLLLKIPHFFVILQLSGHHDKLLTAFIKHEMTCLNKEKYEKLLRSPREIFDVSEEKAELYFLVLKEIILKGASNPELSKFISELIKIPAILNLINRSANPKNRMWDLLSIANSAVNQYAASLLISIPALQKLAKANDYYQNPSNGIFNIKELLDSQKNHARVLKNGFFDSSKLASNEDSPLIDDNVFTDMRTTI